MGTWHSGRSGFAPPFAPRASNASHGSSGIGRRVFEDLETIQSDTTVRILRILRQYVRPRNEVLGIRRVVNYALQQGDVGEGNVFAEYLQVKEDVERLKQEKMLLAEQLRERSLRKQNDDTNDQAKNMLLGNIFLQKAQKQVQILQIYQRHLNQLIGQKS